MIVPDVNLLVYAYNKGSKEHEATKYWWEETLNSGTIVLLPWIVVSGFIRLVTSLSISENPLSAEKAIGLIQGLLALHNVSMISQGDRHLSILKEFAKTCPIEGRNFTDAQIASLVIEYNATLYSNDTDFLRYAGLKLVNPLKLR